MEWINRAEFLYTVWELVSGYVLGSFWIC